MQRRNYCNGISKNKKGAPYTTTNTGRESTNCVKIGKKAIDIRSEGGYCSSASVNSWIRPSISLVLWLLWLPASGIPWWYLLKKSHWKRYRLKIFIKGCPEGVKKWCLDKIMRFLGKEWPLSWWMHEKRWYGESKKPSPLQKMKIEETINSIFKNISKKSFLRQNQKKWLQAEVSCKSPTWLTLSSDESGIIRYLIKRFFFRDSILSINMKISHLYLLQKKNIPVFAPYADKVF